MAQIMALNGKLLGTSGKLISYDTKEIPTVSNIKVREGLATWDAPDLTAFAKHNPIVSYIIYVNEVKFETTDTYYYVANYLVNGINTIKVEVKVILEAGSKPNNINIAYSKQIIEEVEILEQTLATNLAGAATAAVGKYIYIIGGEYKSFRYSYKIYKFDTSLETFTTLTTKVPFDLGKADAIAVGDVVYIFGIVGGSYGGNAYKFDTKTETFTKLDSVKITMSDAVLAHYNDFIYIIGGGVNWSSYNSIYRFNLITETAEKLSVKLPTAVGYTGGATFGQYTYIFSGSVSSSEDNLKTILKFDAATETVSTIAATFAEGLAWSRVATVGKIAYIFGGNYNKFSSATDHIYKFDSETETLMKIDTTLPITYYNVGRLASVANDVYIFGGQLADDDKTFTNKIVHFTA